MIITLILVASVKNIQTILEKYIWLPVALQNNIDINSLAVSIAGVLAAIFVATLWPCSTQTVAHAAQQASTDSWCSWATNCAQDRSQFRIFPSLRCNWSGRCLRILSRGCRTASYYTFCRELQSALQNQHLQHLLCISGALCSSTGWASPLRCEVAELYY